MSTGYQPLTAEDQRLYRQHRAGIDWQVRQTFPSIPRNYPLYPVTIRKQDACATIYDFKIALPNGKFAKVSFLTGGLRAPLATGEKEPEPEYQVDPRARSSAYD